MVDNHEETGIEDKLFDLFVHGLVAMPDSSGTWKMKIENDYVKTVLL